MKHTLSIFLSSLLLAGATSTVWAQQIYRCEGVRSRTDIGAPEYTNNAKDAQSRGCKVVAGGNVTVVQGTPVAKPPARVAIAPTPSSPRGEGNAEQRARDSDSRLILESELRKSETRLTEQLKEYNNGEPEKQGIESRNYQRYLDRVSDLKEGIARSQSDIAGLKREISRLPASN